MKNNLGNEEVLIASVFLLMARDNSKVRQERFLLLGEGTEAVVDMIQCKYKVNQRLRDAEWDVEFQ